MKNTKNRLPPTFTKWFTRILRMISDCHWLESHCSTAQRSIINETQWTFVCSVVYVLCSILEFSFFIIFKNVRVSRISCSAFWCITCKEAIHPNRSSFDSVCKYKSILNIVGEDSFLGRTDMVGKYGDKIIKTRWCKNCCIPAANPYVVLFARSIASSNVLNFKMDCTGPKIYATIRRKAYKQIELVSDTLLLLLLLDSI